MVSKYLEIAKNAYIGYFEYLKNEMIFNYSYKPWYANYFWGLIIISLIFFLLEWVQPWRKDQPKFRKDFWLDLFYMFFNFFLFSLVVYNAVSDVFVNLFNDFLALFGLKNLVAIEIGSWSRGLQLLILFILRDFIHWWVHRLLHYSPRLWQFHKIHHSVEQMGFAAHLRFHWMETVTYRTIEYIPLAMIGFGIDDFFLVHIFALFIGHWNHANFNLNIGPLKYIFNNPSMHIWHHAKTLPAERRYGVNFGLSLSIWDYLFGTAYIPYNGRDIEIGIDEDQHFPHDFKGQVTYGFGKTSESDGQSDH
ncbi:sterol desaturase family protein [Fulvivirga ligni]|uniref:sterol desaturase family protein n=1 Tax=Fulvivirga ligni TaxID=2904246 RepID=UPI001F416AA6|nr:sterol desaturase family protein [Fulvivirga ligni]UII23810.1 sterol desaturase family protein [Fulvivirga ligni]